MEKGKALELMAACMTRNVKGLTYSLRGCRSPKGGGYREAQLLGSPLEAMVRAQDSLVCLAGPPDKDSRRENCRTDHPQWK